MNPSGVFSRFHDRLLAIILLVGLVHALIYVFLVPPWQHYDEPTHFEYAWLVANRPSLPQYGDYDQEMRRQVATSMLGNAFFSYQKLSYRPNLQSQNEPIWIGISELAHPPAYYLWVSVPLRLLRSSDVTLQLYVSRLMSLLLYLASIAAAWGLLAELFPQNHTLRWMVPASMALLPGFVDLMTAVNNDVGAVAIFSFCLWGCVHLAKRGISFVSLFWTIATAVLGVLTKTTVLIVLLLVPVSILFAIFHGRRRRIALGLLSIAGAASLFTVLNWGDAAFWYRNTRQPVPTRTITLEAPTGTHALQLQVQPSRNRIPYIRQFLSPDQVTALRGKAVTLGAWMWATRSAQGQTPLLVFSANRENQIAYRNIPLEKIPGFNAFEAVIPDNASAISVILEQWGGGTDTDVTVFYSGVVLAEGRHPRDKPPQFNDPQLAAGVWGEEPFNNLVRNASASNTWLSVTPWVNSLFERSLGVSPAWILHSLFDWEVTGWYYSAAFLRLFRTFWATFSWGGLFLLGSRPYFILGIFTLLACLGTLIALWRERHTADWGAYLLLAMAMTGIWFPTLVRGLSQSLVGSIYIPVARYAYPAIIPTLLVLNLGWLEVQRYANERLKVPWKALVALYLILFLIFDAWALLSLVNYYYGGITQP